MNGEHTCIGLHGALNDALTAAGWVGIELNEPIHRVIASVRTNPAYPAFKLVIIDDFFISTYSTEHDSDDSHGYVIDHKSQIPIIMQSLHEYMEAFKGK